MDGRKWLLPAAVLVGGAVLGRLVGIRGLVRAGMAALTLANVSKSAGLLTAGHRKMPGKAVQRSARKRTAQRKSARKTASAPAGAQTH
jgi:hypothetical protein